MTSSSVLRALWIVLLPFALVNLVGWMFPHAGSASNPVARSRKDTVVAGWCRDARSASVLENMHQVAIGVRVFGKPGPAGVRDFDSRFVPLHGKLGHRRL